MHCGVVRYSRNAPLGASAGAAFGTFARLLRPLFPSPAAMRAAMAAAGEIVVNMIAVTLKVSLE